MLSLSALSFGSAGNKTTRFRALAGGRGSRANAESGGIPAARGSASPLEKIGDYPLLDGLGRRLLRWARQGGALLCCLIPIITLTSDAGAIIIVSVTRNENEMSRPTIKDSTKAAPVELLKNIRIINITINPKCDSATYNLIQKPPRVVFQNSGNVEPSISDQKSPRLLVVRPWRVVWNTRRSAARLVSHDTKENVAYPRWGTSVIRNSDPDSKVPVGTNTQCFVGRGDGHIGALDCSRGLISSPSTAISGNPQSDRGSSQHSSKYHQPEGIGRKLIVGRWPDIGGFFIGCLLGVIVLVVVLWWGKRCC